LADYDDQLLRVAFQCKRDALPVDRVDYPMEPENRKIIHALLPQHIQSCGPIVDIEDLCEIHINQEL